MAEAQERPRIRTRIITDRSVSRRERAEQLRENPPYPVRFGPSRYHRDTSTGERYADAHYLDGDSDDSGNEGTALRHGNYHQMGDLWIDYAAALREAQLRSRVRARIYDNTLNRYERAVLYD